MPTAITESEEYHIGLLGGAMEEELYDSLFWSRFTAFTQKGNDGMEIPAAAPISMKREFGTEGMTSMKIPRYRRLVRDGVYGSATAEGTGEDQRINYQLLRINQRRKVVNPPDRMGAQRIKKLDLLNRAKPQLSQWLAEHTEWMIASAIYEGYSYNVTLAAASSGYAQTKYQHPHICTVDAGEVTWSATDATYKTNIHNAVSALTGAAEDKFNFNALYGMATKMSEFKIQPMKYGGADFWCLVIHDNQWRQLIQDSEYKSALENAGPRDLQGNPLFQSMRPVLFAAGFMIFVRRASVYGVSTAATPTVTWGATNPLNALDTYDVKGAIAFGNNFLCGGWAFGPHFTVRDYDHEDKHEIGMAVIDGYAREDFPDSTSSPTESTNQTSALLLSYSPASFLG